MLNEFIINNSALISLILRGLGIFTCVMFILPLMLREARIKNGLRPLRLALLAYGVLFSINNAITIFLLIDGQMNSTPTLQSAWLRIINATFIFILNMIGYIMYHFQFSSHELEKHKRYERYDKKEKKLARRLK